MTKKKSDKPKKDEKSLKVRTKKITKASPKKAPEVKKATKESFSVAKKDLVELPAIDMSAPEEEIIPKIIEMMSTVGFLYLKNIKGFDEE